MLCLVSGKQAPPTGKIELPFVRFAAFKLIDCSREQTSDVKPLYAAYKRGDCKRSKANKPFFVFASFT